MQDKMQQLHYEYPLSANAQRLCRIYPDFEDLVDDDILTDGGIAQKGSDEKSNREEEEDSTAEYK